MKKFIGLFYALYALVRSADNLCFPSANVIRLRRAGVVQNGCATGVNPWLLTQFYKHFSLRYTVNIIVILFISVFSHGAETGGEVSINLAVLATVSGSGKDLSAAVDGIKQKDGTGEWVGRSPNGWTGRISLPKNFELKWEIPQKINKVVIYDRPTLKEHMGACVLIFSDGSKVHVFAIPNDGSPKTVIFEPRTVISLRLDGVDGVGENIGLSEIEVYYDPAAQPEPERIKNYTDYVSYVDPTIETSCGRWFFCTPGSRPFGMVCASAYTRNKNGGGGGYNYNSNEILGFANIHAWIMSGINLMPIIGDVNPNLGEKEWKSSFSHDTEVIEPGYHKVFLDRYKTQVEYTSTDRVVFYRFKYSEAAKAKLLLQLGGYVGNVSYVDGKASLVSANRIEGSHGMTDRVWNGPKLNHVFFIMEFDRPILQMDGWKGETEKLSNIEDFSNPVTPSRLKQDKRNYIVKNLPEEQAGVSLAYDVKKGEEVLVKIGMSYTSIENARRNLKGECSHWDFDKVRRDARREWNQWLGKIAVKGGREETRVKFYTDLWHVLLGRHKIDDLNGDYPSYMGKPDLEGIVPLVTQRVPLDGDGRPLHHMYNHDALWLTMWNLNTLWGLGWPEMIDEFSASLMQYARVGGKLPRGPCGGGYTGIMRGNPATSLMTAAYQKNLMTKVVPEEAFEQMKKDHMPGGMMEVDQHYIENGWAPGKAGETIQWAFEDWALAQMAAGMNKSGDAKYFLNRSAGWRALVHPETGLVFPKNVDGSWIHTDPFSSKGWIEANSLQGTFGLSHDIKGLAKLMGGPDELAKKLNYAFEQGVSSDFVSTYVSYGNQPSCSNAHVFNYVGYPWLSQYWVSRVSRQTYGGTNPNIGYGGHDEDQGQMGGVSALMKLGLFSLQGTCSREPIYEITAPEFDEVVITLDPRYYSGNTFKIKAYGNSEENCYIQKAKLNGKVLENCWFYHKDFAKGGLFELWLGPKPNKSWGVKTLPPPD
ncbi:MAG: GH92 family glycosyl hydrolase [Phycisphaerae bacterium]|nr:GH92 family glycosyl hydrolase [Phycisphaerae bacterium]